MGYTNIENCIIKPHKRYSPKEDYPRRVLLCHHRSYLEALQELQQYDNQLEVVRTWEHARDFRALFKYKGIPIVLDNSRDNAEETATHVIEHFFWSEGPLKVINISSAGGISPDLSVGDSVIGLSAVRDNDSVHNLASEDTPALSSENVTNALRETSPLAGSATPEGDIWSTGNMYYTWEKLQEVLATPALNLLAVETEMAAICIIIGWLNHNYAEHRSLRPPASIGNLFYISDQLPCTRDDEWRDTMNDMRLLYPFKVQSLLWAIHAISSLKDND